MFRRLSSRLVFLIISLLALSSVVSAQGGPLSYNTILTDTLNPGTPIIYTFSGTANDMVTVYVIGSSELQPTLAVSNSSGQPLGFSNQDALTPISNDVRVTALLPANDTYIVTLNNTGASPGIFTLALSASQSPQNTLSATSTIITIAPSTTGQQLIIPGNPDGSQDLSIQSLLPGVGFSARLQSADGKILAVIAGGLNHTTFNLPASDRVYFLTVDADDATIGAQVEITLGGASVPAPATTEEAQAQQPADPNVCTVTASGVNVRSGPGTNYGVVGSLNDGNQFIATGQNSGWYYGTFNGQSAWVAASVVTASGNCSNLAFVDAPAPPPPTATTASQDTQATATTSSSQPTATTDNQQPTTAPPTATTAATTVPFAVVSLSCRWFQNDGATVDFHVTGAASTSFRIDVRQGSTTYSADRTMNQQGFLNANQRFGQAGNSNYVAYIVYNNADISSADC